MELPIFSRSVKVFLINELLHLLGMVKLIKSIHNFMRMFPERKKKEEIIRHAQNDIISPT